jgi:hypothetical protein
MFRRIILVAVFAGMISTGGLALANNEDSWPWWDAYFYDPTPPRAGYAYPGAPYYQGYGPPYYQGYGPPYYQGFGPPYYQGYGPPYVSYYGSQSGMYPAATTVPYSYYGY